MFDDSCLVVAHPDDEILWFSSIIERMSQVLLCFVASPEHPGWTEGRRRSIENYPLEGIQALDLDQASVFDCADWGNPVVTDYGLEVRSNREVRGRYEENYALLYSALRSRLSSFKNVVTHNPWGEYGHEEHVQVFRVVKALQVELGFRLWCSNYCSNKSLTLFSKEMPDSPVIYTTFPTNRRLAETIMSLYQRNSCWTWYENYRWFEKESFVLMGDTRECLAATGHLFPMNMLQVPIPAARHAKQERAPIGRMMGIARRVSRRLRRVRHGLNSRA